MSKHPSVVKLEEKLNGQFASSVLYLEVYDRHQGYGGPEEGGWWYHTMFYTGTSIPLMGVLYDSHDFEDKEQDDVNVSDLSVEGVTFLKYYSTWDDEGYDYDFRQTGSWKIFACLTEDVAKAEEQLISLGFGEYKEKYDQGRRLLLSYQHGQHEDMRRPRYE